MAFVRFQNAAGSRRVGKEWEGKGKSASEQRDGSTLYYRYRRLSNPLKIYNNIIIQDFSKCMRVAHCDFFLLFAKCVILQKEHRVAYLLPTTMKKKNSFREGKY